MTLKVYQVWASGGPFDPPYNLGLYAAPDEAQALDDARQDNPEIAGMAGVYFSASRAMSV